MKAPYSAGTEQTPGQGPSLQCKQCQLCVLPSLGEGRREVLENIVLGLGEN